MSPHWPRPAGRASIVELIGCRRRRANGGSGSRVRSHVVRQRTATMNLPAGAASERRHPARERVSGTSAGAARPGATPLGRPDVGGAPGRGDHSAHDDDCGGGRGLGISRRGDPIAQRLHATPRRGTRRGPHLSSRAGYPRAIWAGTRVARVRFSASCRRKTVPRSVGTEGPSPKSAPASYARCSCKRAGAFGAGEVGREGLTRMGPGAGGAARPTHRDRGPRAPAGPYPLCDVARWRRISGAHAPETMGALQLTIQGEWCSCQMAW